MHRMIPSGAPLASAASLRILAVSRMQLAGEGCGLNTTAFPDFNECLVQSGRGRIGRRNNGGDYAHQSPQRIGWVTFLNCVTIYLRVAFFLARYVTPVTQFKNVTLRAIIEQN